MAAKLHSIAAKPAKRSPVRQLLANAINHRADAERILVDARRRLTATEDAIDTAEQALKAASAAVDAAKQQAAADIARSGKATVDIKAVRMAEVDAQDGF